MAEQRFKVSGMHCASCAMLIDEELEEVEGVAHASTSYTREQLEVSYDENVVSGERIAAVVGELGYQAQPL